MASKRIGSASRASAAKGLMTAAGWVDSHRQAKRVLGGWRGLRKKHCCYGGTLPVVRLF
jgi:hypothetical protein